MSNTTKAEVGAAATSLPRLTYKFKEACAMLGISPMSLRREIQNGRIKTLKKFRHVLIPAGELTKWVEGAR
ncbi:DNA-binding protein [bacterium]|nr:DNA-binding protein [bacterium]